MPSSCAISSARRRSLEAIAITSLQSPFCIAGITFLTAILAVPKIPQRTLFGGGVSALITNSSIPMQLRLRQRFEMCHGNRNTHSQLNAQPHDTKHSLQPPAIAP